MDLNRILNIIREDMMNTDPGRTQQAGFSSKADDPVAGYDSIMDLRSKYGRKLNALLAGRTCLASAFDFGRFGASALAENRTWSSSLAIAITLSP